MIEKNKIWNKNYFLLLQGMGVSQFGDILYSLAISYYVYDQTGSTLLMSLIASISMFYFIIKGCSHYIWTPM